MIGSGNVEKRISKPKRLLTVIKISGALVDDTQAVTDYIGSCTRCRSKRGDDRLLGRCVLVHGGGPQINRMHDQLGMTTVMKDGIRVTPKASIPIIAMVLRGQVNASLCAALSRAGILAIGLSGADLGLYKSELISRSDYGLVGGPPQVDIDKLGQLLTLDWVPVCCSLAVDAGSGELLNVNADMLADAIARSAVISPDVGDVQLDLVSGVPGVLNADGDVVPEINQENMQSLVDTGVITGGMIPKVQSALASIDAGVSRVRIGNFESLMSSTATTVRSIGSDTRDTR